MSLNKFTDIAKNKKLNLQIGCDTLECNTCIVDNLNVPVDGNLTAHNAYITNNLSVTTSNGDVSYTTPDKGQPNYSLHTDGAGGTFWSPDDTGSANLTYNGTIPVASGQHLKFSNIDSSTVNESKLIENATDLDIQGLNLTNVGLINGGVFPDITDLNSKTQNIDLAGTVPNTTQLDGSLKFNATSTVELKRRTDTDLQLLGATNAAFTVVGEDAVGIRSVFGMRSGGDGVFLQFDKVANTDPNNNLCIAHQGSACDAKLFRDGSCYLGNDFEYNEGNHDGKENGVHIQSGTLTTNPTSGALKVSGGVGVSQDIQVAGNIYINGSPCSTGAYSTIDDKIVDAATFGTNPETLVLLPPLGIGNPLVLPNKFKAGGHYALRAAGTITCAQNTNCTFFIILGNPNPPTPTLYVQGTLPIINLGPCTDKAWQLDAYVTVRKTGGPNVAENIGRMEFRTNIDQQNNFFGDSVVRGETVLFNTLDLNAFDLQFQWNTTQTNNAITCSMFVGNTIFQP